MQAKPGDSDFPTTRRTKLFSQLVELFLQEGFAHLTLDDIAARLRCSKSTLYTLADSKEQLVQASTVHFFRQATAEVEAAIAQLSGAHERVISYLLAVGEALAAASDAFMTDLAAFRPARAVYAQNTEAATKRLQGLIAEGVAAGEFRATNAAFAADLATSMMVRIQQGEVHSNVGLDDAHAYRELAAILTSGIRA